MLPAFALVEICVLCCICVAASIVTLLACTPISPFFKFVGAQSPARLNKCCCYSLRSNKYLSVCLQILSTFGDLALQLGEHFEKFIETVKRMLSQAMHLSVMQAQNSQDDDFLDYNNELRIGILEAYSGIFQGLGTGTSPLYWL